MTELEFYELLAEYGLYAVKGGKGYRIDLIGVDVSFSSAYLTFYGLSSTHEAAMRSWLRHTAIVCKSMRPTQSSAYG